MRMRDHLDWPVCAHDQEACRVVSAHRIRQPLQSGAITPVQIFQDEYQRAGGGEHLQSFRELAEHAGRRDAASHGLEALLVFGGEQGWEVYEPARGVLRAADHRGQ